MMQKYLIDGRELLIFLLLGLQKTTPELSYFQESDRNYIANENKSGANYIEWKGTVEEFKEAIKKLTDKKSTTATPKKDEKPTPNRMKNQSQHQNQMRSQHQNLQFSLVG